MYQYTIYSTTNTTVVQVSTDPVDFFLLVSILTNSDEAAAIIIVAAPVVPPPWEAEIGVLGR